MTGNLFQRIAFAVVAIPAAVAVVWWGGWPLAVVLAVLGVGAVVGLTTRLSFVLVLPHAARMPYEARQMLPFGALLMATGLFGRIGAFLVSVTAALTLFSVLHGTPWQAREVWELYFAASVTVLLLGCGRYSLDTVTPPLFDYLLRLGDDRLVLGHRLSEWFCPGAPGTSSTRNIGVEKHLRR